MFCIQIKPQIRPELRKDWPFVESAVCYNLCAHADVLSCFFLMVKCFSVHVCDDPLSVLSYIIFPCISSVSNFISSIFTQVDKIFVGNALDELL